MKDFVKLSLKGEDFTFTALDFGQLQELEGDFAALKGLDGKKRNLWPNPSIQQQPV